MELIYFYLKNDVCFVIVQYKIYKNQSTPTIYEVQKIQAHISHIVILSLHNFLYLPQLHFLSQVSPQLLQQMTLMH